MSTILDTIVAHKRLELARREAARPLARLRGLAEAAPPPRGFAAALAETAACSPAIIAEVKRGSPSLGCVRPELDVTRQVELYEAGGAAALSILTDQKYFFGSDRDFAGARRHSSLPMLRKDFMISEYQIWESRAMGADCILLIMAILDDSQATRLADLAHQLGMDVLAEAHTAEELSRIGAIPADLTGINNRNLKTFTTSEAVTLELAATAPDRDQLIAESGLHSAAAVQRLWTAGIRRFLVGEAFVRSDRPAETVAEFANACTV